MINLLPPTARKFVTHEYWMRVVIVWLLIVLTVILITVVLQVPSYYLLRTQLAAYQQEYASAKSQQADFSSAEKEVKAANTLATHVYTPVSPLTASEAIATIKRLAGNDINVSQFSITSTSTVVRSIDIRGVASTRTALAAFSNSLVEHEYFTEANVPIANLAKDQDINFEIKVIPTVFE